MSDNDNRAGCAVCRLIRVYLLIAVPLIIALAFGPEPEFLKEIDLINLVAGCVAMGLVVTVAWRAYQEYWRK
jgi:hypothetical protein